MNNVLLQQRRLLLSAATQLNKPQTLELKDERRKDQESSVSFGSSSHILMCAFTDSKGDVLFSQSTGRDTVEHVANE